MLISNAYAQAAAAPAAAGNPFTSMLPLVVMFVILYFIMIRPQMKKQKQLRAMLDALQKGDEVVTAGGVVGRIAKISDTGYLTLEVGQAGDKAVEMTVQRAAVQMLLPKGTMKSL